MPVYAIDELEPTIADSAYISDEATVIGAVRLAEHTSIWPGAVVRADNEPITIGESSNVQDGVILHVDPGFPLNIGARVTVGHQAMLHGCTIGDGSLIGIQAVVLNGAVIGPDSLVGAGAIVTEGKVFPPRSLILGAPARVVRELSDKDLALLGTGHSAYVEKGKRYRKGLRRLR
ncbi:MAG: gamma carbonic anhydrase family protein [Rhodocyclaceae bacterium]|nr:gamma carbonic anhydrase family protein [Rhodocyclaceae bacterium]